MSRTYFALGIVLISVVLTHRGSATAYAQQQTAFAGSGAVRLPPTPIAVDPQPVAQPKLGPAIDVRANAAPSSSNNTGSLLWSGSLSRHLDETAESMNDPASNGVQPVTWSALELAQRTVPQGIYAGADYLLLKPRMSEPVPFFSGSGNNNTININANTYDFNFQSSPRVFLGWRNAETGSALQFTYWHFQESTSTGFDASNQNSGFIPNAPMFLFLIGNGFQSNNGDSISSQMKMNLNVYDIEFYKPMVLGGGRWLMTGSIGARILDYRQTMNTIAIDSGRMPTFSERNDLRYTGAGPRASFEARRIVGANGALYARGGCALLVGTHNAQVQISEVDNSQQPPQSNLITVTEGTTRVITNGDFELGGSWRFGDHVILSAGWMVAAFTDLAGMPASLNLTNTANILSFDGLVARAAVSW
ncbi:MAG TPA: Lpg1974 family pore-forming outer membrane protein [Pirellulales bacterium]|jgi:hypothetical protein